jgi:hypothetical protein
MIPELQKRAIIRFDARPFLVSPDQREPLPEALREAQLQGRFKRWEIPGFHERLRRVWKRNTR